MDNKGSGTIARPAPPGRRRGPASRNVSSASTNSRWDGSPSMTTATLVEEESDSYNVQHQSEGLGLFSSSSVDPSMSASSEIPLEEVEKALSGLSREDLVLALKRAKEQMDILDAKMDTFIEQNEYLESKVADLTSQVNLSEAEMESLQIALQQREDRVDELIKEQYKDEDEVYAKVGIIERLRKQLEESERARADVERRYQEQTATSDKERQYYLDMESLLQTQKSKASTAHERILTSNQELSRENERLQHLVSQLRLSSRGYSRSPGPVDDNAVQDTSISDVGEDSGTVSSQDISITDEHDISISSRGIRSLQDEARSLELEALRAEFSALQKSHDMLNAQMQQSHAELGQAKTVNAELRDQNETFMDILQEKTFSGALIEKSAVLNRQYMASDTEESEADTDDVDDVPDEPRKQQRVKRREVTLRRSQDNLLDAPTSLASELETSDSNEESSKEERKRERRRERSEVLTDNVEDLHKEIWSLRDANQALTLYVTKILDRIIAKEGYENVLAIDGDDKSRMGTLRGTPIGARSQRSRPSIEDAQTPVGKPSRRASGGGLLSFIGGGTNESGEANDPDTPTAATSPSFATRARRTASIDWRALIGAGGLTSPVQQQIESLKSPILPSAPRKISSSEEVEDIHDQEEKEKIRKAMISHGISLPDHQLKSQKRASGFGTFFTRVIGASVGPQEMNSKRESNESVVIRGDQHPGPRLTTFDSPPMMGTGLEFVDRPSSSGMESTRSSSPRSRNEARQRALDLGNSGNLTEMPKRTSPISSRRSTLNRRDTSSTSVGDSSRGESVAGDESYQYNSPVLGSEKSLEKEEDADSSWGKALKRMSLMAAQK